MDPQREEGRGNMMKRQMTSGVLAVLLAGVLALPAVAQTAQIDYLGFGYETGGILPSDPGDELVIEGVADNVSALFGVDLGSDELTFHVSGLVSTGQVVSGGLTSIDYTGGTLEIYQDGAKNADWGINPPNPTAPSTFTDGSLFFSGDFTSFTLYFATGGYGSFAGNLDGTGGTMIDGSCTDCVYTWSGAFSPEAGAQIPDGYDLQFDGVFQIDSTVDDDVTSWGSVKALFND